MKVMKQEKVKSVNKKIQWAYIAPNGWVQLRSIADTKREARELICQYEGRTFQEYENAGFHLKRIIITVVPLD